MKSKVYILLSCLLAVSLNSALAQSDTVQHRMNPGQQEAISIPAVPGVRPLKPLWNLNVGTNMMFVPHTGTFSGFSVTPVMTLPLSARLSVYGGASFMRLYTPAGITDGPGMKNAAGVVSLFGSASYKLNRNITLYGTGIKTLGNPMIFTPFSPYLSDSFTLGSEFRLGNHITLGASVRMSGQPYDYVSPFNQFNGFNRLPGPFPY